LIKLNLLLNHICYLTLDKLETTTLDDPVILRDALLNSEDLELMYSGI